MENVDRWISHSAMSDTGRHHAAVAELPEGIGALNSVIQGLIIHTDWLAAYGVQESQFDRVSRETLPVAERLALVLARDPGGFTVRRPPELRTVGTCRDFALMLCGFLRSKGISAALLDEWRHQALTGLRGTPQIGATVAGSKRIKDLERELRRKDKALAEAAALIILQKKVREALGDEDDDTAPKKDE